MGDFGSFKLLISSEDFIYISETLFGAEASEFFNETILLIVAMFFLCNLAIGLIIQLLVAVVNNTFFTCNLCHFNNDSASIQNVKEQEHTFSNGKKFYSKRD